MSNFPLLVRELSFVPFVRLILDITSFLVIVIFCSFDLTFSFSRPRRYKFNQGPFSALGETMFMFGIISLHDVGDWSMMAICGIFDCLNGGSP